MSNNVATHAFIAFLRCEAQQAEERAKSLRATAATIEANSLEGKCRWSCTQQLRCLWGTSDSSHILCFYLPFRLSCQLPERNENATLGPAKARRTPPTRCLFTRITNSSKRIMRNCRREKLFPSSLDNGEIRAKRKSRVGDTEPKKSGMNHFQRYQVCCQMDQIWTMILWMRIAVLMMSLWERNDGQAEKSPLLPAFQCDIIYSTVSSIYEAKSIIS